LSRIKTKLLSYPSLVFCLHLMEAFDRVLSYLRVDDPVMISTKEDEVCVAVALILGHRWVGPRAVIALGHNVPLLPDQPRILRFGFSLVEVYPAIRFRASARSSAPQHLLHLNRN